MVALTLFSGCADRGDGSVTDFFLAGAGLSKKQLAFDRARALTTKESRALLTPIQIEEICADPLTPASIRTEHCGVNLGR
jgi:hypothetical protein